MAKKKFRKQQSLFKQPPPTSLRLVPALKFWQKRLDHTLQHTQSSTRLIYFVDGAVLALCYFIFSLQDSESNGAKLLIIGLILAFLAIINHWHAAIIKRQGRWYRFISIRICNILRDEENNDKLSEYVDSKSNESTHNIYSKIHEPIFCVLIASAIAMLGWAIIVICPNLIKCLLG